MIELLKNRGLQIIDENSAINFLDNVSYFRLNSYLRPMEQDATAHTYKPNATFENAVKLYEFDANNTLVSDFKALLSQFPNIDAYAMGFPDNWQDEPLWSK